MGKWGKWKNREEAIKVGVEYLHERFGDTPLVPMGPFPTRRWPPKRVPARIETRQLPVETVGIAEVTVDDLLARDAVARMALTMVKERIDEGDFGAARGTIGFLRDKKYSKLREHLTDLVKESEENEQGA